MLLRIVIFLGAAILSPFSFLKAQVIHLSVPEGYVVAQLFRGDELRQVERDRWYYSVRTQQLFVTQGGVAGTLLDGRYSAFYPGGEPKEQGALLKGLKHGEWRAWYDNGRLRSVECWRKGLLHGPSESFDEHGTSIEKKRYRRGDLKAAKAVRVRKSKDAQGGTSAGEAGERRKPLAKRPEGKRAGSRRTSKAAKDEPEVPQP